MKVKARETASFKTRQESACLETKKCEKNTLRHYALCILNSTSKNKINILTLNNLYNS